MGVNDAREQLEVAKAEAVRLETELEQVRRLHEVATSRCVELLAELIELKGGLAARDAAKWAEGLEAGWKLSGEGVNHEMACQSAAAFFGDTITNPYREATG